MTPKRPRSHQNADLSIVHLQEKFISAGWTAEELGKDYGEDLLVRIFKEGSATEYSFFVQAKSVESTNRYLREGGAYLKYPISFGHLDNWERFWQPVVLAVWERTSGNIHWEMIQDPEVPADRRSKKPGFYIPVDNRMDEEGLKRILARTERRFDRFQREKVGADFLIDLLSNILDAEIDYNPQDGLLIVEDKEKGMTVHAFGVMAERIRLYSETEGVDFDTVLDQALKSFLNHMEKLDEDPTGKTAREFIRKINRDREIRD